MRIGVLAAQGAFAEHMAILRRLEVEALPVRLPEGLDNLDGLIIPGGESTTISRLLCAYNLTSEIKKRAQNGLPLFGTCAGMILLASEISSSDGIEPLGMMSMKVNRNAFGRQRESFEAELSIPVLGAKPFPGVFIRAPEIEQVNGTTKVLARLDDGTIVAARQGRVLACAFHPELTDDIRFHRYFLDLVASRK